MLVVISNPAAVTDETTIINDLFDEGLEVLHLRKPDITIEEIRSLLKKIKPQYYQRIALHQHHDLADDFGIKRLHYKEANRKKHEGKLLYLYSSPLLRRGAGGEEILSTSIHQIEDYKTLSPSFTYTFFGPLFDSISKPGYTSKLSDDFVFPIGPGHPKVIAIGGINATNIQKAIDMNFDGVAALGTIWSKPEDSVRQFKTLQKAWEQVGR
jgi:thiamine-phosphate pyrophosphorylase